MNGPILRSFDAEVTENNDAKRTIVARIQTSDIDHYNTVIVTRGLNLQAYLRNPVFMWEHCRDPRRCSDPIGKTLWVKPNDKSNPTELIAKFEFLDDEFSLQRYSWYRQGVLRGFSVKVIPDWERCSPATREEIKVNPELGRGYFIENGGGPGCFMYRGGTLAEISGTGIPGNSACLSLPDEAEFATRAAAIMTLFDQGSLWLPDEAASIYRSAILTRTTTESMGGIAGGGATVAPGNAEIVKPRDKDEPPDDDDEDDEATKRYITEGDGKWTVHAEDGKPMGSYGSKSEARKRLREIEYFKAHPEERSVPAADVETVPVKDVPRGLRIEPDDHGMFVVHDGPLRFAAYDDRALAEKAITAMGRSQTFGDVHAMLIQGVRGQQPIGDDIARYIKNEIDLRFNGSVGTER